MRITENNYKQIRSVVYHLNLIRSKHQVVIHLTLHLQLSSNWAMKVNIYGKIWLVLQT